MKSAMISVLILAFILTACSQGNPQTEELTELKIQTMWVPNAQFAGYYVAMDKGYYAEEGLKVVFNEYDEEVAVKEAVTEGSADFGIDGADQVIVGRSEGKPLKAIATPARINPTAFASLKEKNILKPADLANTKAGYLPDNTGLIFDVMISRLGVDESNISRVPYGYDFNMLYSGEVDVIPVYIYDEPYIMEQEGYQVNVLHPQKFGIKFYGDTIFTTEQMIKEKPELVEGFLKASLRGWQYALENQDETLGIVMKYAHEDYQDEAYEEYILSRSAPLIHTGEDHIGWMKAEVWSEMEQVLNEEGFLEKPVNAEDCYTLEFLNTVYAGEVKP